MLISSRWLITHMTSNTTKKTCQIWPTYHSRKLFFFLWNCSRKLINWATEDWTRQYGFRWPKCTKESAMKFVTWIMSFLRNQRNWATSPKHSFFSRKVKRTSICIYVRPFINKGKTNVMNTVSMTALVCLLERNILVSAYSGVPF